MKVTIQVDTDVLTEYGAGALVRVERSATETGAYAELGTVAVVAGKPSVTYYDLAGAVGDWYRARYSKATPTTDDDYSAYTNPFQADKDDGYTNVSAVKARLGITDTEDDAILATIVAEVNSWLTDRLGRPVGPEDGVTYVFDGDGTNRLRVSRGVRSITELKVGTYTGATQTTVSAGDIFLVPPSGERGDGEPATTIMLSDISGTVFGKGYGTVTVTGNFGYASVPDAIAGVALNAAVAKYRARASAGGDTFTVGIDGERTFERFLSYEDKLTIRRYGVGPLVA